MTNEEKITAYIDKNPELESIVTEQFPFFIAHEYQRFHELVKNGQIFGAFFEMKDVLEVMLKFPILVGTAYIESRKDIFGENESCLSELIRRPLSLGQWLGYSSRVMKLLQKDKQARPIQRILRSIRLLYERGNVVNWRNTRIGHGAVAGDIMQYAEDFQKYSAVINKHCRETAEIYTELKIMLHGKRLSGYQLPEWDEDVSLLMQSPLEASFGEITFDLRPYIFVQERDIYFFDSMHSWRLVDALDYVNGRKIVLKSEFFLKKYRELVTEGSRNQDRAVTNVVFSSDNSYLNGLNAAQNYVEMDNLNEWLMHCLNDYDKGVFMLRMERGMGKTAFAGSIDQLLHGDEERAELMDTVVRCYYCNRLEFRSTNDFVAVCNTALFSKNKDAGLNIEGSELQLKTLSLTGDHPSQEMADYLEFYRNIYDDMQFKDKLLFVIDGLDEITSDRLLETGKTIFDYIPVPDQLADHVYVIVTCRTGDEEQLPEAFYERIRCLATTETYTVERESQAHRENLRRYLKAIHPSVNSTLMETIIDKTGRNYVKLKLFVSLMQLEIRVQDLLGLSDNYILGIFLQKLELEYGEKLFAKAVRFLTLIVNAYTPLSLEQVTFLMGYQETPIELITILYDLGCLLDLKRTEQGTRIRLANETFRKELQIRYVSVMRELLQEWMELIRMLDNHAMDRNISLDLYRHEGAIYLYGNILKYVDEWALPEQKAKAFTKEFADAIYHYEGKVDGRNHGYQGILWDISMSAGAIRIYEALEESGQMFNRLNEAYCYNNRGYHKGISLSDAEGAEKDFQKAYEIVAQMAEKDERTLSVMGTFSNNMVALMGKWHLPLEKAKDWSKRSRAARKQLMVMDFKANAENYMQSVLNYANLLEKYSETKELPELYAEMESICDQIKEEYPEARGMLRAKGNRVNFGYVFQLASMRIKCAQRLAAVDDSIETAIVQYQESIADFRELLELTEGKQVTVHEALYKALYFIGKLYRRCGNETAAKNCWDEAAECVQMLKSSHRLYSNQVLAEMRKVLPQMNVCGQPE